MQISPSPNPTSADRSIEPKKSFPPLVQWCRDSINVFCTFFFLFMIWDFIGGGIAFYPSTYLTIFFIAFFLYRILDSFGKVEEQDETFGARKKDSGKWVTFGSEQARDDAIDSGDYERPPLDG